MAWKHIGALALLALGVGAATMQDATPAPALTVPFPEVVIYEPETGALYNVTADGIQSGANLSDVAAFAGQLGYNYQLSPDRSKLFFVMTEMVSDTQSNNVYYVADVASGACCEKLDPQDANMNAILGGEFSPDGSLFIASYGSNQFDQRIAGQLIVFDVATKAVVARLDSSRLDMSLFANQPAPGISYDGWTDSGLLVHPTCMGCEPPLTGMSNLWAFANDSLSPANIPFNMENTLLTTGENLRTGLDTTFPNNPDAVGMLPVPNVVLYAPPPGDPTVPAIPQVVYFNPNNIYINRAQWVADGLGIFIQHADPAEWFMQSTEAYVLLRDGTKIPVTIPLTRTFLEATSDGWVMTDTETSQYVYYRLTGATVEEIALDATYTGYPVIVEHPKFGNSAVNMPAFATIAAP